MHVKYAYRMRLKTAIYSQRYIYADIFVMSLRTYINMHAQNESKIRVTRFFFRAKSGLDRGARVPKFDLALFVFTKPSRKKNVVNHVSWHLGFIGGT